MRVIETAVAIFLLQGGRSRRQIADLAKAMQSGGIRSLINSE